MADDRDALMREVDEELRREQMEKFWRRYNGVILGGAALIVLGVAGYKIYDARARAQAETAGADFNAAVALSDQNKTDEAVAAFEKIAASGPRGYASLAKLHVAGAYAKAGKKAEAVTAYEALQNDTSADTLLKNFARMQAASLRMEDADFTEMENRLKPLTVEPSPYKVTASELLGFAAFKAGKLKEARTLLEPLLIDPAASADLQERIKIVMSKIAELELGGPGATAAPAGADKAASDAKAGAGAGEPGVAAPPAGIAIEPAKDAADGAAAPAGK